MIPGGTSVNFKGASNGGVAQAGRNLTKKLQTCGEVFCQKTPFLATLLIIKATD